ncbi:Alkaline phosphatase family protein (fragment) [Shewanella benthica]|uniref:Alkaline phosphatase family protein n=1 Tax=Shewanella benthica TaxID=43661 RepID=A0A330M7L5_9GAMM
MLATPVLKGRRYRNRAVYYFDVVSHKTYTSPPNSCHTNHRQSSDPATTDHVLGLFNSSHMEYDYDRTIDGATGEPSLAEMTAKSIDILNDHAHHAGNAARALYDTIALSEAVRVAMEKTSSKDTLLIVTADHSRLFRPQLCGYTECWIPSRSPSAIKI